eukprot:2234184-Pyramimonas_sp.AAC.1
MPSSKGGMSATEISEVDVIMSASRFDVDEFPSIDDVSQAEHDFERIARGFRTARRRRAAVPRSVPNEIWSLLLSSRQSEKVRSARLGVESPEGVGPLI